MLYEREPGRYPYKVKVDASSCGWESCCLPNGREGWCVYLKDYNKFNEAFPQLTVNAFFEIRAWMSEALGLSEDFMDDNIYGWGVTFEHKEHAFLCYMHFLC